MIKGSYFHDSILVSFRALFIDYPSSVFTDIVFYLICMSRQAARLGTTTKLLNRLGIF